MSAIGKFIPKSGAECRFDMIRTALNITGDAACAIIVDRYSPDYDPNRWSKEA